jgi:hypothetical protein
VGSRSIQHCGSPTAWNAEGSTLSTAQAAYECPSGARLTRSNYRRIYMSPGAANQPSTGLELALRQGLSGTGQERKRILLEPVQIACSPYGDVCLWCYLKMRLCYGASNPAGVEQESRVHLHLHAGPSGVSVNARPASAIEPRAGLVDVIVLGNSTGGPQALKYLVPKLPAEPAGWLKRGALRPSSTSPLLWTRCLMRSIPR